MSNDLKKQFEAAIGEIELEYRRAVRKYPRPFYSRDEAWGVLMEEVEELWEWIRVRQGERDVADMRAEAIQVGAMAIRALVDLGMYGMLPEKAAEEAVAELPYQRLHSAHHAYGRIVRCAHAWMVAESLSDRIWELRDILSTAASFVVEVCDQDGGQR